MKTEELDIRPSSLSFMINNYHHDFSLYFYMENLQSHSRSKGLKQLDNVLFPGKRPHRDPVLVLRVEVGPGL